MQLQNLKTKILGKNIIYYKEIDSTQDEMWKRIQKNEMENGTLILADIQTKARRNPWKKMVHRRRKQYCLFFIRRNQL